MVRHWERAQREKIRPLPPVIPVVVYHGREQWQVSENFAGLFEGPEALRPYWPNFRYELHDLSRYSIEDIRGGIILRVVSMFLMSIFDPRLAERLPGIFQLLEEWDDKESAIDLLEKALRYLSATAKEIDDRTIRAALKEAFKDDGGSIMGGFVEKWIEKGKQEGLQQGQKEGQQQGLRNAIFDLLLLRFDAASATVSNRLAGITDLETLRQLHLQAATAESLADFEQYLETL